MRVALVHSFYSSAAPSGENVAVELQCEALRHAGIDAEIISVSTDDLNRSRLYPVRTAATVATGFGIDPSARLRRFAPDVVHVHNLFPNFSTRWLANWPGTLVATFHNYRPMCSAGTLARDGQDCFECVGRRLPLPALQHRCYKHSLIATAPVALRNIGSLQRDPVFNRADQLIMLAPRSQALYERALGGPIDADRVSVVPNFVDPIDAPIPASEQARELPWIYVGRLSPEKGIVDLLQVWPDDLPLHVYGSGAQLDQVKGLARGQIEYRGSLPREELLRILPQHCAVVMPSMFSEGLPTVYLEGLAAGLPLLARAGNSAADDAAEHGTGLVFNRFDEVDGLARAVAAERTRFSKSATRRYQTSYSESAWVEAIQAAYCRALRRREARSA